MLPAPRQGIKYRWRAGVAQMVRALIYGSVAKWYGTRLLIAVAAGSIPPTPTTERREK